ncbi:DUF4291 family protein [Promicromonospora soli]
MNIPKRQVRAVYDADTITVYQAYPPEIADAAVRAGRFVPPFKRERMTWVKPSFCWMMYRCGWATKPGQERVLEDITDQVRAWRAELVDGGRPALPDEVPYALPTELAARIGADNVVRANGSTER